uniref:Uncharacterized protein n=1 Tax=Anguilla anguilla TaxID=7936 RepID=A0A0E9WBK6_ANGAN
MYASLQLIFPQDFGGQLYKNGFKKIIIILIIILPTTFYRNKIMVCAVGL